MNHHPGTRQLEVQIMGQSYTLACPPGGEEDLLAAVRKVDAAMSAIRAAGKVKARDRIAVLASLNIAYELASRNAYVRNAPEQPQAQAQPQADSTETDLQLAALLARLDQALADGSQQP